MVMPRLRQLALLAFWSVLAAAQTETETAGHDTALHQHLLAAVKLTNHSTHANRDSSSQLSFSTQELVSRINALKKTWDGVAGPAVGVALPGHIKFRIRTDHRQVPLTPPYGMPPFYVIRTRLQLSGGLTWRICRPACPLCPGR